MDTWTSQSGYPILNVTNSNNELTITQNRFFMNHANIKKDTSTWPIPLLTTNKEMPDSMAKADGTFSLHSESDIRLNVGGSGFYRTIYDTKTLERLGSAISKGSLKPLDRLSILADLTEASKASYMPTTDVLTFLKNYSHESNNAVWDIIAGLLGGMRAVMDDETVLYIEVPFEKLMQNNPHSKNKYLLKKHWHEHINFFSESSLHELTKNCGLKIVKQKVYGANVNQTISNIENVLMIACKKDSK
jgi:aminopeptidase N